MAYTRPANSTGARAADSANKLDKKRSTIRKQPILHSYIRRAPIVPLAAPRPAGAGRMLTDLLSLSAYAWPKNQLGGGVVAILSCFGGWRPEDVSAFAETLSQPVADVIDVPIDATNDPRSDDQGDWEMALDIQLAAASYCHATGSPATIRVYWTLLLVKGIQAAVSDGCDVCSISWAASESKWSQSAALAVESTAKKATDAGMVVLAASGDNNSSDGGPGNASVDLPSSCPHVIGCGGTRKTMLDECVWNANPGVADGQGTGGGFSQIFTPLPNWQIATPNGPGKMVPDVSANADSTVWVQDSRRRD
jgi:kumamolisin